jgi:uncharacterized protein YndB with AHSA1/START domain
MKTLTYTNAKHQVTLELPKTPDQVFTDLVDLRKWWPEDYIGEEIRPDTEFVLKTGDGHVSNNKVVEFVPDKRLVWLTTASQRKSDGFDWSGTKFIFDLAPKGDHTELTFTYDGVVLEDQLETLVKVCDRCVKEMFYSFAVNGIAKQVVTDREAANKSFAAVIEVTNSPQEIFQRITADVAKWWGGKDLSGRSINLNDEFVVNHPGAHYSKQQLVEVVPDKRVVWLVTASRLSWLKNQEEWTDTRMVFEISSRSHSHLLHFTHEGLIPAKESYARCSEGWNMVIKDWLYTLIMYGIPHF